VRNKPFYVVLGVTVNGERDILGIWAGAGGEGAKYWLGVLTEIKNRGVEDVCIAVCDGLKGLPEAGTLSTAALQIHSQIHQSHSGNASVGLHVASRQLPITCPPQNDVQNRNSSHGPGSAHSTERSAGSHDRDWSYNPDSQAQTESTATGKF
jgi:hypothetical protein